MPLPTLAQMLDVAEDHARTVLVKNQLGSMIPVFDLRDAKGDARIVAGEFTGETPAEVVDTKDAIAKFVRTLIQEHDIVQYSFLSEAWMIVRKAPADYIAGVSVPPSEADDRVEVVICTAQSRTDFAMRRWRIKRDKKGCVVDLVLDSNAGEKAKPSGRFDSLLEPV